MADEKIAIGSYDLSQLSIINENQAINNNKFEKIEPTVNNIKKYITMTNGEIKIGSSDSNIKMKINNESVDLINIITNAILCTFNTNTTVVKNINILNNLKVRNYSFKYDEYGNIFFGKD